MAVCMWPVDTLKLNQVYGAITYYPENRSAVDESLVKPEQFGEEQRRAEAILADLRRRLESTREQLRSGVLVEGRD